MNHAPIAIGDIHGCYQQLETLLTQLAWDPKSTPLWLVGDLINRGPNNIRVLEFCYQYRDAIQLVLGNHDVGFLAYYFKSLQLKNPNGFEEILAHPDSKKWIDWLISCPFIQYEADHQSVMTHAGLWPFWSLTDALEAGKEASQTLQNNPEKYCQACFKNPSENRPSDDFWKHQQFILNAFTRMRYCLADGTLLLHQKGHPNSVSKPAIPWFEIPNPNLTAHIIFGHWAALKGQCPLPNVHAIDSGCVWGEQLTAFNLQSKIRVSIPGYQGPLNSSDA